MSTAFDPYYKWLGIPPEEQPPNHYRLLGLRIFEHDGDVIEAAAEQRMLLLRSRQAGPQAEVCQRLLNEIAAAQLCLLDAGARQKYNQTLRSAVHERAISGPPPLPSASEHADQPVAREQDAQEHPLPAPPAPVYVGEGRITAPDRPPARPPSLPTRQAMPPPQSSPIGPQVEPAPRSDEAAETAVDAHVIDGVPPVDSWHVQTPDGSYWGPVSRSELEDWADNGRITRRCKLLPVGTNQWLDAEAVLTNLPAAPPDAPTINEPPGGIPEVGFRCPHCGSDLPPREYRELTPAGWALFIVLLLFCLPTCLLALLLTRTRRVCRQCGRKS